MTWSISIVGRSKAVQEAATAELERQAKTQSNEHEAAAIRNVARIVTSALTGAPPEMAIRVTAFGSGSDPFWGDQDRRGKHCVQSVDLKIEPLYGFVE